MRHPAELEDELFDKMVEYYKDNPNVTVIVDRREGPTGGRASARRGEARDPRPPPGAHPGDVPGDHPRDSTGARGGRGPKSFQNYIGGEWVDAAGGETFESVDPATGEALGEFPRSDRGGRRPRRRRGEGGLRGLAPDAGAEARRRCSTASPICWPSTRTSSPT